MPEAQSERIFGALVMMAHILRVVSPGTSWPSKAAEILSTLFLPNPFVENYAMGVPEDWDGRAL